MDDDKISILAQKHVTSILIFLLEHDTVNKTDLVTVVHSNTSVDKLVNELDKEGFISVRKEFAGRNTYYISLTNKGRAVARRLKDAQEVSESPIFDEDNKKISLELSNEEIEKAKHMHLLYHVNVLDDHVTVEELTRDKPSRVFNIYIKKNGNGIFRLWCEFDDSYTCWHVREAWGYPQVQKMMTQYKGNVKVCQVCGSENPERAKFCMECGAKLE